MFKAKPLIPPGRILLELERSKDKIKRPKIKVGDSEISLMSPVRGDRGEYKLADFSTANILANDPTKDTDEFKMVSMRKNSATFLTRKNKLGKSHESISEMMKDSSTISDMKRSNEMIKKVRSSYNKDIQASEKSPVSPHFPRIKASLPANIKYQTPMKRKSKERTVKLSSINLKTVNRKYALFILISYRISPRSHLTTQNRSISPVKPKSTLRKKSTQQKMCQKLSQIAKNNKKMSKKKYSQNMDSISTTVDRLKGAIETYEEHLNADVFNKDITFEEIKEENENARVRNIDNFLNEDAIHKFKNENFLNSLYLSHMQSKSLWKPDKFKLADRLVYNIQQNK